MKLKHLCCTDHRKKTKKQTKETTFNHLLGSCFPFIISIKAGVDFFSPLGAEVFILLPDRRSTHVGHEVQIYCWKRATKQCRRVSCLHAVCAHMCSPNGLLPSTYHKRIPGSLTLRFAPNMLGVYLCVCANVALLIVLQMFMDDRNSRVNVFHNRTLVIGVQLQIICYISVITSTGSELNIVKEKKKGGKTKICLRYKQQQQKKSENLRANNITNSS